MVSSIIFKQSQNQTVNFAKINSSFSKVKERARVASGLSTITQKINHEKLRESRVLGFCFELACHCAKY